VSPVPLVATYTSANVLVASSYSKAVLRAAAGEVEARHPHVAYFPSYEIISHAASFGQYLESDLREVAARGVHHVMTSFLGNFLEDMKAVILAGGLGTRLSEETTVKPKPMVEIGGKPILWHILKSYSAHGINDFVICCGYKGYVIKEFFANYFLHMSDVTFDLRSNRMEVHERHAEPWRVTLVDTGDDTHDRRPPEARAPATSDDEAFCFTYGDGVADIDIGATIAFHKRTASWPR
jgi:hypothetical protein